MSAKTRNVAVPEIRFEALDFEILDLCVRIVQFLGLPRSVGECYAALFVSPRPLCMEEVMKLMQLSKGATSQGLRLLRDMNAIRTVYVPGDRRDFYQAEENLLQLVSGFLEHRIEPAMRDLDQRLSRLEAVETTQKSIQQSKKLKVLRRWEGQARNLRKPLSALLLKEERS